MQARSYIGIDNPDGNEWIVAVVSDGKTVVFRTMHQSWLRQDAAAPQASQAFLLARCAERMI